MTSRTRGIAVGAALTLAVAPAIATASTLTLEGDTLVYRAAPGVKNSTGVQAPYSPDGRFVIYDYPDPVTSPLPAPCAVENTVLLCSPPPGGFRAELGDGDDWATVSSEVPAMLVTFVGGPGDDRLEDSIEVRSSRLEGGPGLDTLRGGPGNDSLDGAEDADTMEGGAGDDLLLGGAGDDVLMPDGYEDPGRDVVDGGAGVDEIEADYSTRRIGDPEPPVTMTLGGGGDDGRPGEGDDLRSVERIVLAKGGTFTGSDAPETVQIRQALETSVISGGGGDDDLSADGQDDRIDGGAGNDKVDGGFGDDVLTGGPGRDQIFGDRPGGDCGPLWCRLPYGNDVIDSRDGEADSVACGAGTDRVTADAADTVAPDCETVERGAAAAAAASGPGAAGASAGVGRRVIAPARLTAAAAGKGIVVRLAGMPRGKVAVKVLHRGRALAKGRIAVAANGTARLKVTFTKAEVRALRKAAPTTLVVVAGGVRATIRLAR